MAGVARVPAGELEPSNMTALVNLAGQQFCPVLLWKNPTTGRQNTFYQIGKHRAGRLLDGRTHDEVPR